MIPIDQVSSDAVGESIRIHREPGRGLLESVYETVLAASLVRRGYRVDRQHPVAIVFDGIAFPAAFRVDLLVDERLVVEIKSVGQLSKLHAKQVFMYLRLLKQPVGLLLNFSGLTMKEGIRRLVNDYRPEV